MKKLILLLLICTPALAAVDTEKYAVQKEDGSVVIAYYNLEARESVKEFLEDSGLGGLPYKKVRNEDLALLNENVANLKLEGNRLVLDEEAKQEEINKIAEVQQAKDNLLEKLKITEDEAKLLRKI